MYKRIIIKILFIIKRYLDIMLQILSYQNNLSPKKMLIQIADRETCFYCQAQLKLKYKKKYKF